MNVDSSSDSKGLSSNEVASKYFSSKGVMDESLSDFQEKKSFTRAKNSEKAQKATSKKSKKSIKKIRGQKDIRTVLKKKNELIAYSNDFDKVCKQSGIDVDSEQLQLAIALSKSLQQTENTVEEEYLTPNSLPSQERTGKIRTTLQEYGFVVPEIKITATKSRKLKKYRKSYKLLQTTDAEKQQIISDKYSQVLFHNLDNIKDIDISHPNKTETELYHIGTNISYEEIKDNDLLYVENLLEKSPSFVGCLLKNLSDIPGRPESPSFETSCVKFEKIYCTQEELDIVLSGQMKTAQEIVKNKYSSLPIEEPVETIDKTENCAKYTEVELEMDTDCIEIIELEDTGNKLASSNKINEPIEVIDVENPNLLTATQNLRSCSPDIFDDEVSEILDSPCKSADINPKISVQNITKLTKPSAIIMDLTECVNMNTQTTIVKPISQLSQGDQTIKRRSNDFMDITECVVGSSQPIRENIVDENIDLTQNSDDDDNITIATKPNHTLSINLTQSSDTNEELPPVQISGNKSLDDTIILNEDAYSEHINAANNFPETKKNCEINTEELTTSNNFSPIDKASITIESEDESDNKTNIENDKLEERAITPIKCVTEDNNLDCCIDKDVSSRKISVEVFYIQEDKETKSKTESFFEEFIHHHSESSKENTNEILCVDETSNNSAIYESDNKVENDNRNENDDIDLTQATDTSEETVPIKTIDTPKTSFDCNNLGKIDNVSIDYDELYDNMANNDVCLSSQCKNNSSRTHTTDLDSENIEKPSNSDLVSNSSQNSEAFEISDKELDYSIHKSRLDIHPIYPQINFDFGGISVVDNLPDLPSFRPSTDNIENKNLNRSMSDSYLPMVDIKRNNEREVRTKSCCSSSPTSSKISNEEIIAKTPKNGEYVIKTDGVTPILDYERMTTPERNAELNKYGLKPFKRKRAVQLLTHLYNQTHPIVESLENLPSPSKKLKTSDQHSSPTKKKSPRKNSQKKSTNSAKDCENIDQRDHEIEALDKENNIYDVINEVPVIKDIECCEEDWVFQKREKAKLHSCRVPLHIALHNYVSSRQRLRESILRYEPVNIDDIHKGLVNNGFRYDPKDLLKFLDKKCITVKTADNNGRNKKH